MFGFNVNHHYWAIAAPVYRPKTELLLTLLLTFAKLMLNYKTIRKRLDVEEKSSAKNFFSESPGWCEG